MSDVKNSSLATDLVSYWELEEASGTRVDSHGSNDLTDNNTVGQATGKIGNGADFERNNAEFLSIDDADQTGLDITGDFTYNFWYKPETLTTLITPFSKWNDGGNQRSILNFFYENGDLRIYLSTNGSSSVSRLWNTSVTNGTWSMITICYAASAGSISLYEDNVLNSTKTGYPTSIYNSSAPFRIGSYNPTSPHTLDGVVDEFGIWTRVITSTERANLYNSGDGLPYNAGGGGVINPTLLNLGRL